MCSASSVAGVSDTERPSRLHVAVAHGPGWEEGWLTSPSTDRRGYLQLIDLAPTALAALGRPMPGGFFVLLAVVQVALAVAVLPLLRRARRHAGPPWWRFAHPAASFAGRDRRAAGGHDAAGAARPRLPQHAGPLGAVAGLTTLAVGLDVVTGARLQLNGVVGYSALEGGRYAGLGTVGLGVFVAAALLSAGWLAQRVRRGWRPTVMVIVAGPPWWSSAARTWAPTRSARSP